MSDSWTKYLSLVGAAGGCQAETCSFEAYKAENSNFDDVDRFPLNSRFTDEMFDAAKEDVSAVLTFIKKTRKRGAVPFGSVLFECWWMVLFPNTRVRTEHWGFGADRKRICVPMFQNVYRHVCMHQVDRVATARSALVSCCAIAQGFQTISLVCAHSIDLRLRPDLESLL